MSYREVLHILGGLFMAVAVTMIPCALLAIGEALLEPWLLAIGICGLLGLAMWRIHPPRPELNQKEALAIVGLGWIALVVCGMVPFLTTGVAPSVAGAFFESTSGFTTTGATVFPVIEDLPGSILLWRSISHFIGGMGIIVLGVAILPLLGVGGAQLFRAEAPGIATDRLRPRIATTARLLWGVYVGLTVALLVLYLVLGMTLFEAVNHSMSALATGGFSTRTSSMADFSPAIQWVTILFMFLAGVNFTLHYRALTGNFRPFMRNAELNWYLGSILLVTAASYVALGVQGGDWLLPGVRRALFNVVAIQSTTGFATDDFGAWPSIAQMLFLGMMFVGAMGGSTGGGFKVVRGAVVAQHVVGELKKILHPRAVIVTRLGGRAIRPELVDSVLAFLALYVATWAIGAVILASLGSDLVTSISGSIAALSSIGPGLGDVGPVSHYGNLSGAAQVTLAVLMLLGRLEFYTLLVLLIPETWKRAKVRPRRTHRIRKRSPGQSTLFR